MSLYFKNDNVQLYNANMLDMGGIVSPNSVDCIVTDPPYELGFMGKSWDSQGVAFQASTWKKCCDALKPGGYLLAFGGSRTFHRIACAIEDAGFEIRDTIMWLYGSGFPKSLNISKTIEKREMLIKPTTETLFNNPNGKRDLSKRSDYGYVYKPQLQEAIRWQGWGTSLKPSYEPIIIARKPCEGTCVDNVLKWGVGGLNIDECRVATDDILIHSGKLTKNSGDDRQGKALGMFQDGTENTFVQNLLGRFPANTILTYSDEDYDEVCGGFPNSGSGNNGEPYSYAGVEYHNSDTSMFNGDRPQSPSNYNDSGSASRYFYCAKASKRDRDEGLENFEEKFVLVDDVPNEIEGAIKTLLNQQN